MKQLKTEKEKALQKRNANIRADFARLRAEFPDASNWRIYGELSKRYDLTVMTIRNIMQSVKNEKDFKTKRKNDYE